MCLLIPHVLIFQIVASGILTGAIVFGLTIFNLVRTVSKFTPPSITRGIQLGIGLDLVKKACGKDMAYVQVPKYVLAYVC